MNGVKISPIDELNEGLLFDPGDGFLNGKQTATNKGFKRGNWYNPIEYYTGGTYNINDGAGLPWEIKVIENKKVLHYPYEIRRVAATLCYGEMLWQDYEIRVKICPLSWIDYSGIAFRYQNSRCYYALVLGRGNRLSLIRRNHDEWIVLYDDFQLPKDQTEFVIGIRLKANHILCFLDHNKIYDLYDDFYQNGCIAALTYSCVNFHSMEILIDDEQLKRIEDLNQQNSERISIKRSKFPESELYKVVKTPEYSSGQFRVINNGNEHKMVFIQAKQLSPVPMVGNVFYDITCITVTNLNGEIIWQYGKPGEGNSNSFCYQVCDIDNDGKMEMIVAMNFKILVLDFETGNLKKKCPTPLAPKLATPYTDGPEDYYPHICGDAIYICDLKGYGKASNFLIKDRYNNVWAYDSQLAEIWHLSLNTGHFPYSFDLNNDGLEEILLGHSCITAKGILLWNFQLGDHIDQICVGNFCEKNGEKPKILYVAGEEGFVMTDLEGNILIQRKLGHLQKICIGHFSPRHPGQQFVACTLWGEQGLVYTIDCEGTVIKSRQFGHNTEIKAVNWIGDGQATLLYDSKCHPNTSFYDFELDQIGEFSGLDSNIRYYIVAKDVLGDSREEIMLGSPDEIKFYTQNDNNKKNNLIPMKRLIDEINFSLYRPDWLCRK